MDLEQKLGHMDTTSDIGYLLQLKNILKLGMVRWMAMVQRILRKVFWRIRVVKI